MNTGRIKSWKKISSEIVLDKYNRKIEKASYLLPSGKITEYYIRVEGPAVGVLALTKDNKVIVTRQYRPGPNSIQYDLPGGFVDPAESGAEAIERELMEETGYAGKFKEIAECYESSYSTMKYQCYVATNCIKITEPVYSDEEQIEVVLLELSKFREMLSVGGCGDIQIAYMGLDYLGLL